MNGLRRWRSIAGAFVALFSIGLVAGSAQAAELEGSETGSSLSGAGDGFATLELGTSEELEALSLSQRYAPPPPRYSSPSRYAPRSYRPYRPYWGFRIVPPPIFAPGWFGLYFWGAPPPPVQNGSGQPVPVRRPDFRHVNEYNFGVNLGGYAMTYGNGEQRMDPGIRFSVDYRHAPVLGAQFAVGIFGSNMRPDGTGSDARMDIPIQMSAVLHAFPRAPIQPYFLFGGTANIRTYRTVDFATNTVGDPYTEMRVGPHAGIGLELLIGDRVSMTIDGRSVWYTLVAHNEGVLGQTGQHDRTVTGGLNFYF